jgi:hypothetical protein
MSSRLVTLRLVVPSIIPLAHVTRLLHEVVEPGSAINATEGPVMGRRRAPLGAHVGEARPRVRPSGEEVSQ